MLKLKDQDGNTIRSMNIDECDTIGRMDLIAGTHSRLRDGEISRECAKFSMSNDECTLLMELTNRNPITLKFPNGSTTIMTVGDKLPIPKMTECEFATRTITLDYDFEEPSIFSQLTEDGDETEKEDDDFDAPNMQPPTPSQIH
jgi:hypothetical protein